MTYIVLQPIKSLFAMERFVEQELKVIIDGRCIWRKYNLGSFKLLNCIIDDRNGVTIEYIVIL